MSLTLSKVAEILINDGRASANDGEILTRFVKEGAADRASLDDAKHLIEQSDLSDDLKRSALRQIATFMGDTANGVESAIAGLDVGTAQGLARRGVRTSEDLLYVGANASRRYAFAKELGMTEKELRVLVKQADLQRVPGVTPKLAMALLAVGVDSVPELAYRSASSLAAKLDDFAKSTRGWVMQLEAPSLETLEAFKAAAKELPRLVEFTQAGDSIADMSIASRVELMVEEDNLLEGDWQTFDTADAFFAAHTSGAVKDAFKEHKNDVLSEIADRLSYVDIDVDVKDLAGVDQDEIGYYFDIDPSVTTFKGPDGELVGAKFYWGTDDGSEGEYWSLIYDAIEGRFTGLHYSESANGESELNVFEDEAPPIDLDALKAAGKSLAESWGDESIQDGVATVIATKAEFGWGSPGSFAKSVMNDYFENDDEHDWDGWVGYGDVYPFTPSALDRAATSINNLGFMYANQGEVARLREELEEVVAALGPRDTLVYSTSTGRAVVEGINNNQPVDAITHLFLNPDSGAYVAVIARKGSY